jgi:tetratricopeptide (TPR) repeat protein
MIRIGKSIHCARFFIAAVILFAAGVVIFWPDHSVSTAASGSVKKAALLEPHAGVESLLKEAEDLQAKGRLPQAVSAYEKVLGLAPEFAPVYLKLGQIYFRMNLPSKAEEVYLKAIDKGLNDPDVFLYLGYIRETRGDLDQAMSYYDKAQFAGSRNPVLYFNMGNVHARQDHKDKALEYFKRAVILDPKYMDAFVNLAIVSAETGEYEDAQFYLEKAEKLGYDAPAEFKSGLAKELKKL